VRGQLVSSSTDFGEVQAGYFLINAWAPGFRTGRCAPAAQLSQPPWLVNGVAERGVAGSAMGSQDGLRRDNHLLPSLGEIFTWGFTIVLVAVVAVQPHVESHHQNDV
jgi:hypothetical protein